jgi:hypothetical protein
MPIEALFQADSVPLSIQDSHLYSSRLLRQALRSFKRQLAGMYSDICHKIPLSEKGDTIESLKAENDPSKLQAAALGWLKKTVAKLEQEVAASKWAS